MSASTTAITTYSNDADIGKFNRGAITTAFSAPSTCFNTPTLAGNGDWYLGHYRNSFYDPACMPSSTSNSLSWDMYYYSPAISCPASFYTASTVRNSFTGFQSVAVLTIASDTSVYICCPSGYTVQSYHHVCTSKYVGTTVIEYFKPTLDQGGTWTLTSALSTTTAVFPDKTPLIIYADGVPIWYQSSDKETTTTSPTSTKSTANTAIISPTTALTTVTTTSSPTNTPAAGISTGAKAGIGAGIGVVVLGLAFVLAFILLKRRKRNQHQVPESMPMNLDPPKELYDTGVRPELHSSHINELPDSGPRQGRQQPQELAG